MLLKLVPNISRTAELVRDAAAASSEQSVGAGQVNQALAVTGSSDAAECAGFSEDDWHVGGIGGAGGRFCHRRSDFLF